MIRDANISNLWQLCSPNFRLSIVHLFPARDGDKAHRYFLGTSIHDRPAPKLMLHRTLEVEIEDHHCRAGHGSGDQDRSGASSIGSVGEKEPHILHLFETGGGSKKLKIIYSAVFIVCRNP